MPTDRENIIPHFEIPTLQLGKINADAEATFECETIVNPNLMRRLLGVEPDPGICAAFGQSFTFTCKTPRSVQARKHRKKRINKKWAKKYGYKYVFEPLTMGSVSIVPRDEEIDILGRSWIRDERQKAINR